MKEVLFLAPYPDENNIKEGMAQRVKSIENIYSNVPRTYLDISFTKYILPSVRIVSQKQVKIVYLNFFTGFFHIFLHLHRCKKIYCHSVYCFVKIVPHIFLFRKNLIVDMHGVVPEESAYQDKGKLVVSFYSCYERLVFNVASSIICVTNRMADYYKGKYSRFGGKYYVYNISPSNLREYSIDHLENSEKVVVIYSGNTQKWQNIDLMLQAIARNKSPQIIYKILTMEIEQFNGLIKKHGIDKEEYSMVVKFILPSELHSYYVEANYGFILRDDNVVNNVANPTKLVEYLYYGITPIVLNPNIGDYKDYDFILLDNFNKHDLHSTKSLRNKKVIESTKEVNSKVNLIDI